MAAPQQLPVCLKYGMDQPPSMFSVLGTHVNLYASEVFIFPSARQNGLSQHWKQLDIIINFASLLLLN